MKRLIAAVSFAVLATPVLAETGKPYEQLDVDRALPQINFPTVESRTQVAAASGATVSDASIADQTPDSARTTESPWANDWNFIAPAM